MKRLKLGKIQWISLLVVSAMFANLCSHMVLAASASEQTKAKVTTTAAKKTTKTKQEEYKAFWFSYYDYDTYRETNKKRNAKTFRTYFTKVVKKFWNEPCDRSGQTIWRCYLQIKILSMVKIHFWKTGKKSWI